MRSAALAPARYARLCRWALVALICIVLTGGAVRLTGSGLGCSDWPTCSQDHLVPSWEFHGMVEFVNRVITGLVSLAVIAATAGAWFRRPRRPDLLKLAIGLVAGVIGQILLGAVVVLAHLDPRLTLGHFLLSMVLVANAVVLLQRATAIDGARPAPSALARWQRWGLIGLAGAVLGAGTLVTGSGPHGGDDRARRLGLPITSVVRVHSSLVWLLLLTVLATVVTLQRSRRVPKPVSAAARRLLTLVALQGAIGYLAYFTDVPALVVGVHLLGATLVWAAVVHLVTLPGASAPASPGAEPPAGIIAGAKQHAERLAQPHAALRPVDR